ncbi:hypothetical protein Tco_1358719, partial [Tanacetum coccineum]
MFRVDKIEDRGTMHEVKCYNCNGGQDNAIDDDVDEQPIQDLALNVDNVFQADDCDAFDYDVDEAPTAQTMFMANLYETDIQEKDKKKVKNDKTEHGMEKTKSNRSQ